jgi:hypothetical protein
VYYAVEDPAKDVVQVVEANFPTEAVKAVEAEYNGDGTLHAREAEPDEVFRYLVRDIGLSYIQLGERLGVSENYIGHRMRGDRDVRHMDVLALERLRQRKELKG